VIVSTYPLYQAPLGAVFQLTQHRAPLFTVITDLATVHTVWFHRATDLCLVPTERVRDLALKHHLPEERVLVTGLPVHPRIAGVGEDKRALRERLDWPTDLTTLLVVGSRRVSRLPEMLRAVNHSGLPLHLVLVAGGDDELYETFKATTWHVRAHVYNFVEEMPAFMHAADAIVTKAGGLIVSESLACGLPMLLVNALPGQEQGNADLVVEGGAGDLTQEPIALLETLFHWLEDDGALLRSRAARAQELGRPRAAFRIAELVWKAAQGELPTRQSLRLSRQGRDRRSLVAMLRRNQVPWSEE
jgi:1,2-diacylglycerol 3-beta-galactosyltransferase